MKIIWEKHDIKPGSYIIRKSHVDHDGIPKLNAEFATFLICFDPSEESDSTIFCTVSIVDGMLAKTGDSQEFIDMLNNDDKGFLPVYGKALSRILDRANSI